MPRLSLHYDLRHPVEFGVSGADLYAAALDQIAWADAHGFATVGFGEHHQSPDGYLPSPLMVAAAVGARTTRGRSAARARSSCGSSPAKTTKRMPGVG